jgi:predicted DNA-binding transcriptional regulator AlpA
MDKYSTRSAAKELGIAFMTLMRYIKAKKIPAPPAVKVGGGIVRAWTKDEIEQVRKLLPKIANGRKTRYQKLKEKEKTQPRAAVPHKKRSPNKKRGPKKKSKP